VNIVFLGDSVEVSEIDAKSKRAVFLPNEKNRSSVQGVRGTDEPCGEVLVNEPYEGLQVLPVTRNRSG